MLLRKSVNSSFSKLSNLITEEIIMFKKILSLAIVAMLLMSLIAVGVSAAQVEVAEEAAPAEDVAAQGAEADVAATGAGVIKFDAASAGWTDAKGINFYIFDPESGTPLNGWSWGSKKFGGTKDENSDIWSYDAEANGVEAGKQYCIIFQNTGAGQTYDLVMDSSCYGDTASCTGKDIENPVDSNQTAKEAKWANSSLGPKFAITSIGNIVGETIPSYIGSPYNMFVNFLTSSGTDGLTNALQYNGKDAKTTINDTAKALGLSQDEINSAILDARDGKAKNGEKKDWTKEYPVDESAASKTSSTSSTTTSKTSSTSGTTTKSGSASNTQTGQEENVLFIMLGVMVLAAGVIFFVRRKERT